MAMRRRRCAPAALVMTVIAVAVSTAHAATISADMKLALAWQIALEREGFSPGLIDGNPGRKTAIATGEYQRANGLPVTAKLDRATSDALRINLDGVLTTYIITAADVASVVPPPKKWVEKSKAKTLGYESLADCVAERFHCSEALLASLNPGLKMTNLKSGDELTVPAVQQAKPLYANRLEINMSEKIISAFDGTTLVALFHCSIAKDAAKRPSGAAQITGITTNPAYSFDPKMWPEVKDVKQKLLIPPGPRNPVGLCWMALSLPGYGIHGTPNPEMIGKTGSHGCFRLTNWDALRLGKMVQEGTMVKFLNTPSDVRVAAAE